jgi:hypothetical protein
MLRHLYLYQDLSRQDKNFIHANGVIAPVSEYALPSTLANKIGERVCKATYADYGGWIDV